MASASSTRHPPTKPKDAIVRETPVVLTHSLLSSLCVLQYTTRPAEHVLDNTMMSEVEYKPESRELRMVVEGHDPVNSTGADGAVKAELASTRVELPTEYAVARMSSDGSVLTLLPLETVLVMRPSLAFRDRERGAGDDHDEGGPSGAKGGEGAGGTGDEQQRVEITFARAETAAARSRRESSYNYLSGLVEAEPAVSLLPLAPTRGAVEAEADYALTAAVDLADVASPSLQHTLSVAEYVDRLCPPTGDRGERVGGGVSYISTLPAMLPIDRVINILARVGVLRYSQLRSYFPDVPAEEMASLLTNTSLIIHSKVVAASHLVAMREHSIVARRYLIAELASSPSASVKRADLAGSLAIESSWSTGILASVATRVGTTWTLKEMGVGPKEDLPAPIAELSARLVQSLADEHADLRSQVARMATDVPPFVGTDSMTQQIGVLTKHLLAAQAGGASPVELVHTLVDILVEHFGVISLDGVQKRVQHLAGVRKLSFFNSPNGPKVYDVITKYVTITTSPITYAARNPSRLVAALFEAYAAVLAADPPDLFAAFSFDYAASAVAATTSLTVTPDAYANFVDTVSCIDADSGLRRPKTGAGRPEDCRVSSFSCGVVTSL